MNKEFAQKCQFRYKRHSSLNILGTHDSSHNRMNSFMMENYSFRKFECWIGGKKQLFFLWKKLCFEFSAPSIIIPANRNIDSSEMICPHYVSFLSCWQCHHHPKRTPTLLWVSVPYAFLLHICWTKLGFLCPVCICAASGCCCPSVAAAAAGRYYEGCQIRFSISSQITFLCIIISIVPPQLLTWMYVF